MNLPRYPIYIPSKGRADQCLTARVFKRDNIPFHLLVEPQERDAYAKEFGSKTLIVLPFRDQGLVAGLNWLWDNVIPKKLERYWYFDDNIRGFWRFFNGKRIRCDSLAPLLVAEDFSDRYQNVAITGFNYFMFAVDGSSCPPFRLNNHVYSSMLMNNKMPFRWRGPYNADTDMCLQVLSKGWCTVQINTFLIWKMTTMKMKGGNTETLYRGDGRLKMARSLERLWPGVVETKRRFNRPQHVIKSAWARFDNQLIFKKGEEKKRNPNEYGLTLEIKGEIKSEKLKTFMKKIGK